MAEALTLVDDARRRIVGIQRHGYQGQPAPLASRDAAAEKLPFLAVLYIIATVIPAIFEIGSLALTVQRLFLLVVTVPVMAQLLAGRYGRVYVTDILFTLHIVWASVALAVNNPDRVVEYVGSIGLEFLGGYAIGRAYIRTPQAFIKLCKSLVVIVLLLFPLTIFEAKTGRPLAMELVRSIPGLRPVGFVTIDGRLGMERVQGIFAHPIHFGLFCSVVFSLAFVGLKGVINDRWRFVSSAIVGFSGFLALSSAALLAIVLQVGLISWSMIFARVRARWWLLVGLFVLAYITVDLLSNRTPIRVFLSYATFSAHTGYWRTIIFEWGMKNVWDNPIYGLGLNNWVRPWYMYSGSMDNFWLVIAVRYGIPGFLLLATGYVLILFHVMRRDFERSPVLVQLRRAWVFTFMGLTFTLCTVHVWTTIYSFIFFIFGAGVWLAEYVIDNEEKEAPQTAPLRGDIGRRDRAPRYTRFPVRAKPLAPIGEGPVSRADERRLRN